MSDNTAGSTQRQATPRWQPLGAIERRVAGVLAEKAKTTPDAYPMSLNAIRAACNQKSNRFPLMQLEVEDVEQALDHLREMGAVGMIEGYGRVSKYRHYLYDWLGVDKVELAIVAELLLRGAQTEGELRGRAARMEPIPDLSALRPVVASLKSKGLVVPLTPEGRGHVITHDLYNPREMERIKAQYAQGQPPAAAATPADPTTPTVEYPPPPAGVASGGTETFRRQLDDQQAQITQLRTDLDNLARAVQENAGQLRELKTELGE